MNIELRLIEAYKSMADHTYKECGDCHSDGSKSNCKTKHSCCAPEYCTIAEQFAKEQWDIDLSNSYSLDYIKSNTPIKFLDLKYGCLIEPHFRPMCTLHACIISSIGLKPGNPKWTKRYFQLRQQIEDLEMERYEQSK